MKALKGLELYLKSRAQELERFKEEGRKIIGYYPGGYVPEEIILACGAIPVGLQRGGEHEPALIAGAYLPRWYDPFIRSQIGFKVLKGEPVDDLIDLFVIPITDNNVRILGDAWEFYHLGKIFRFGVPHRNTERALAYYLHGIHAFKAEIEKETGTRVTDHGLGEASVLCNRERELFRKISQMRKTGPSPFKGGACFRLRAFITKHFIICRRTSGAGALACLPALLDFQLSRGRRPAWLLHDSTISCITVNHQKVAISLPWRSQKFGQET